jgi:hypothetical protein
MRPIRSPGEYAPDDLHPFFGKLDRADGKRMLKDSWCNNELSHLMAVILADFRAVGAFRAAP